MKCLNYVKYSINLLSGIIELYVKNTDIKDSNNFFQ